MIGGVIAGLWQWHHQGWSPHGEGSFHSNLLLLRKWVKMITMTCKMHFPMEHVQHRDNNWLTKVFVRSVSFQASQNFTRYRWDATNNPVSKIEVWTFLCVLCMEKDFDLWALKLFIWYRDIHPLPVMDTKWMNFLIVRFFSLLKV